MKKAVLTTSLLALLLGGCDNNSATATPDKTSAPPLSEKAVVKPDLNRCASRENKAQCLLEQVKQNGSPEALRAMQFLKNEGEIGYVSAYRQSGTVGVAEVTYPFRANTNTDTWLVPRQGKPIDTETLPDAILQHPRWMAFTRKHKGAEPWPPCTLTEARATDDGQQFLCRFPVRTCHACQTLATLTIGYPFDDEGRALAPRIVSLH